MDAPTLKTVAKLEAAANALAQLALVGAEAYANGGHRAEPIVAAHFTPGNQARYGWAPLSPSYAAWKAGATKDLKAGARAVGSRVPRGALPMLVLTGKTREIILSRSHPIKLEGDTAFIHFRVMDYDRYLQDGTSKMPARSPVDPNESDAAQVRAEMQKYLAASLGTAKPIGVTNAVPPAARATEAR